MTPGDPWQELEIRNEYEQWLDEYIHFEKLYWKETEMPKIHEMIESKYLKKEDLEDEEKIVTVLKIGKANVALEDQPPEMKWMIKFEEFSKPMVLNSTNIQLMAKACGSDDTDDWVGKKVVIYVDDNVSFGGKLVGGIRVRGLKKKSASVEDMESDIPF